MPEETEYFVKRTLENASKKVSMNIDVTFFIKTDKLMFNNQ